MSKTEIKKIKSTLENLISEVYNANGICPGSDQDIVFDDDCEMFMDDVETVIGWLRDIIEGDVLSELIDKED